MFAKIRFALVTALLLIGSTFAAVALTPAEIQRKWAAQSTLTGTFITQYEGGNQSHGDFHMQGPLQLVMEYRATGGQLIFNANGIAMVDVNYPANNTMRRDNRLKAIFSTQPSFAGYHSSKGSNAEHTVLGFAADEGAMKVYFSNRSGQLSYLVIFGSDGKSTTQFFYD
jgi:outer membrane lipoprotein-sorting protein